MSDIELDIVATCWTSAGDVLPASASERSPHDLFERMSAVAQAGFMGMGIVYDDLVAAKHEHGFQAVRRFADQVGLRHLEVELASDWWLDERTTPWRAKWELLCEAAAALRSPFIKIGTEFGAASPSVEPFVASLRRLADEAAEVGTRVALEPLPFALIGSIPQGAELIREAHRDNAGLIVDCWHVFRAGTTLAELEGCLETRFIVGVELDDADERPEPGRTLFEDTRDNRRYPGEGAFDVADFIRTMAAIGFPGPWGVEILSREHRARALDEGLRRAHDSALGCLQRARHTR